MIRINPSPHTPEAAPAASGGCPARFVDPLAVAKEKPASASADRGEVAMHRLRHPFTVAL
jgi:hypothetical protein